MRRFLPGIAVLAAASPGFAESINIDFGHPGTTPAATYRAAGGAGTWNTIGVLAPFVRTPVVNADGGSTGIEVYMYGGTEILDSDNATTSGDDGALLDDMLISHNDPVDACIWIDHVANDEYEVLIYALTPNDPSLQSRVRVDFGMPEPQMVGGAWPGTHAPGVSYGRHTITVTTNRIALHSGLYGGHIQSGINGIQIRPLSETTGAALPELETRPGIRGVHPNPARAGQVIEFAVGQPAPVELEIFDVAGRCVWRRDVGTLPAGNHRIEWPGTAHDGRRLGAGIYFVRLMHSTSGTAAWHKLVRLD